MHSVVMVPLTAPNEAVLLKNLDDLPEHPAAVLGKPVNMHELGLDLSLLAVAVHLAEEWLVADAAWIAISLWRNAAAALRVWRIEHVLEVRLV
jgi:hypothetical protein